MGREVLAAELHTAGSVIDVRDSCFKLKIAAIANRRLPVTERDQQIAQWLKTRP
jgi:hypothetical protein